MHGYFSLLKIHLVTLVANNILTVFTCCLHVVYMLFTCCLHVVYLLFTCCLHVVYLLLTCCLLVVYLLLTVCLHVVYLLFIVVYLLFQAKQRKIKEKYKHQDEEERRLKMEILAVSYFHCELPINKMCFRSHFVGAAETVVLSVW